MPKHSENDRVLAQREKDRQVLGDPDIRGASKGRRGIGADPRYPSGDDVKRVERAWKRDGK